MVLTVFTVRVPPLERQLAAAGARFVPAVTVRTGIARAAVLAELLQTHIRQACFLARITGKSLVRSAPQSYVIVLVVSI